MSEDNIIYIKDYIKNRGKGFNSDTSELIRDVADKKPDNVFILTWPKNEESFNFYSSTTDMFILINLLQEFIHSFYNGNLGK